MNIHLVNYRPQNCEPLKSITQLPEKEAFDLAKKLYDKNPIPGYERFGDNFKSYYHHRIKAEKWLYDEFIAIGGKPKITHPLYFFPYDCDAINKLWKDKTVSVIEKIALNEINICDVSFTFGDSTAIFGESSRKSPFLKDKLLKYFSLSENDIEKLLDSVEQQVGHRIIEAQLWNDKYFNKNNITS